MADYRAIDAAAEAIVALLKTSDRPREIDDRLDTGQELEFEVYNARKFQSPMANGISLLLYRVFPSGVIRTPAGRRRIDGARQLRQLPVELHFLLTVWAGSPSLQHALAGWAMRALEDRPILPSALLNAVSPGAFRPEETLFVGLAELRTEDMLRIWDTLGVQTYQLSIPYLARVVNLESTLTAEGSDVLVETRSFEFEAPAEERA